MVIHKVPELGLELWTEQDPEWETRLTHAKKANTFIAETPALTYPPAHMSWTADQTTTFTTEELEDGARGAIQQVAMTYGVSKPETLELQRRQYGDLNGYEAILEARAESIALDVLVFCGHQPGKPAVVMHVATLKDKLPHLSEHIRRSWQNVRYLN